MIGRSLAVRTLPSGDSMPEEVLKRTPLFEAHVAAGAQIVPFGGWEMPVQYPGGIISEVRSVRTAAGMFDVSHMGRIEFSGPGAVPFLDTVLSANVARLRQGRSKYHVICNEQGGIIDDAIVYRLGEEKCLLVVNAGNTDEDLEFIRPRAKNFGTVDVNVVTDEIAMIAVQGPEAVAIVDRLSDGAAVEVRRFRVGQATIAGISCMPARTGYTGEDGFEIMPPADRARELWDALAAAGVAMCGLGARDVLRLEAGLMLHGNDMTVKNNPIEAGLEWTLDLRKEGYVAGPALREIAAAGTSRMMCGIRVTGRGIPRHGMRVLKDGTEVGEVTSGTHSPTLDAGIGVGYVDRRFAAPGTNLEIDIRGRLVDAEVATLPFYKRAA
jgi:aminomethyltransferase